MAVRGAASRPAKEEDVTPWLMARKSFLSSRVAVLEAAKAAERGEAPRTARCEEKRGAAALPRAGRSGGLRAEFGCWTPKLLP
mmetsp:Transcript_96015/g.266723  ORF Transcript_96015/g.266723 Transcript_96015/m.266723 type:complete len:83 (+) Transcript_96015:41-289(+)